MRIMQPPPTRRIRALWIVIPLGQAGGGGEFLRSDVGGAVVRDRSSAMTARAARQARRREARVHRKRSVDMAQGAVEIAKA